MDRSGFHTRKRKLTIHHTIKSTYRIVTRKALIFHLKNNSIIKL
nr:MAG TPA: hypothetical protein [Caudoviricetes sp.]